LNNTKTILKNHWRKRNEKDMKMNLSFGSHGLVEFVWCQKEGVVSGFGH